MSLRLCDPHEGKTVTLTKHFHLCGYLFVHRRWWCIGIKWGCAVKQMNGVWAQGYAKSRGEAQSSYLSTSRWGYSYHQWSVGVCHCRRVECNITNIALLRHISMHGPLVNNVEAVRQSGRSNSQQVYLYRPLSSSIALLSVAYTTALSHSDYLSPPTGVGCRNLEMFVVQDNGLNFKRARQSVIPVNSRFLALKKWICLYSSQK